MPEGQKNIYYVALKTKEQAQALPQMALLKQKGYDVLLLEDDVDEFMLQVMHDYDKVEFKSVTQGDLDLLDEEENKKLDATKEENKDLLAAIKDVLKDDVSDVILSKRLVEGAVCLSAKGGISLEMEKVLSAQDSTAKAEKVLEINPNHPIFSKLQEVYQNDKDKLADYAKFLLDDALIIEGLQPKDPVNFANKVVELMLK